MSATIHFTRKKNFTVASSTTAVTQRWPVTRSRAINAIVAHIIEHSDVGNKVWQWERLGAITYS